MKNAAKTTNVRRKTLKPKKPISKRGCCGYGAVFAVAGTKRVVYKMDSIGLDKTSKRIQNKPLSLDEKWVKTMRTMFSSQNKNALRLNDKDIKRMLSFHNIETTDVTEHYKKHGITSTKNILQDKKGSVFWKRSHENHLQQDLGRKRDSRENTEWYIVFTNKHAQAVRINETRAQVQFMSQMGKIYKVRNQSIRLLLRAEYLPLWYRESVVVQLTMSFHTRRLQFLSQALSIFEREHIWQGEVMAAMRRFYSTKYPIRASSRP